MGVLLTLLARDLLTPKLKLSQKLGMVLGYGYAGYPYAGAYGYPYAGAYSHGAYPYAYGAHFIGKRSADAEAKPEAWYGAYGYGYAPYSYGYAGYPYGYAGYPYAYGYGK